MTMDVKDYIELCKDLFLTDSEILNILKKKDIRNYIINNVITNIENTAIEIGKGNKNIWRIILEGSYVDPDPNGRWPRIVLPQRPEIYSPNVNYNQRGTYVHNASDIDIEMIFDFFPDQIRWDTNAQNLIKKFERETGVWVQYGVCCMGEQYEDKIPNQNKYRIIYRREEFYK